MPASPCSWSESDDQMFLDLVDASVSEETISSMLRKTPEQLRRRGYDLGLPPEWFNAWPSPVEDGRPQEHHAHPAPPADPKGGTPSRRETGLFEMSAC
jgi:hypothetical protein